MTIAIELLRQFATQPLPCAVERADEVLMVRALRAAGLIEASVPPVLSENGRPFQPPAVVQVVTRSGWSMLLGTERPPAPQDALPVAVRSNNEG